jgi:catechol 2,3-dioxygenase-like lactoylglutathione lyase family enzyme
MVSSTIERALRPVKVYERYHPNTMAFTLDRLDHFVLTVANIDATIDFYTEVLGMDVITLGGRKALTFGVQTIKLHQRGHEPSLRAAHPMPGCGDLCFITTTPLDEVIRYVNDLRVHIEEGPVERSGAMGKLQSVYLRDPDRNLIEISNYL